jgi:hemerythrin-like domain-containing protein
MEAAVGNKGISKEAFIKEASAYVDLLRLHIEKEDTLLFPNGDSHLTDSTQKKLLKDFENLEKNVIGEGRHEELHSILERFTKKYLHK